MFISNLPGMPDNLSYSKQGTIWVPLCAIRHNLATDFMVESVWLRKLICKVLTHTHTRAHTHTHTHTHTTHTHTTHTHRHTRTQHTHTDTHAHNTHTHTRPLIFCDSEFSYSARLSFTLLPWHPPPLPSLQFRIDLQTLSSWLPAYGLILEVDTDGTILRSYHDPKGAVVTEASEVIDLEDRLYIGSYHSRHIVELDMPEGRAGLGTGAEEQACSTSSE